MNMNLNRNYKPVENKTEDKVMDKVGIKHFVKDFFDVYNPEHVKAYYELVHEGTWPKGFIPSDFILESGWQEMLKFKMAEAWMQHILGWKKVDNEN